MAKVIFNADDLGLSHGVNQGILYAYQNGVVNSSSLMSTGIAFWEAVELIQTHSLSNIGLHINLTEGLSILKDHQKLTDKNAAFYRDIYKHEEIDLVEVTQEIEAQYQLIADAGIVINHIDSHHHIHMTKAFRSVIAQFARRKKLPLRKIHHTTRNPLQRLGLTLDIAGTKPYTQNFCAEFYDHGVSEQRLLAVLRRYKGKDVEIMCHPGYTDTANGSYNNQREEELRVLTSKAVKQAAHNL